MLFQMKQGNQLKILQHLHQNTKSKNHRRHKDDPLGKQDARQGIKNQRRQHIPYIWTKETVMYKQGDSHFCQNKQKKGDSISQPPSPHDLSTLLFKKCRRKFRRQLIDPLKSRSLFVFLLRLARLCLSRIAQHLTRLTHFVKPRYQGFLRTTEQILGKIVGSPTHFPRL